MPLTLTLCYRNEGCSPWEVVPASQDKASGSAVDTWTPHSCLTGTRNHSGWNLTWTLLPLTLFLSDADPSNSGAEITSASKSHVSAASSQKVPWESLHCSLCIDLGERSARESTSHVTAVPREPHTLSDLSKVWEVNCSGGCIPPSPAHGTEHMCVSPATAPQKPGSLLPPAAPPISSLLLCIQQALNPHSVHSQQESFLIL